MSYHLMFYVYFFLSSPLINIVWEELGREKQRMMKGWPMREHLRYPLFQVPIIIRSRPTMKQPKPKRPLSCSSPVLNIPHSPVAQPSTRTLFMASTSSSICPLECSGEGYTQAQSNWPSRMVWNKAMEGPTP